MLDKDVWKSLCQNVASMQDGDNEKSAAGC